MLKNTKIGFRPLLLFVAVVFLGFIIWWLGFPSPKIEILEASFEDRNQDSSTAFVVMQSDDLRKITNRQYYVAAYIFECNTKKDAFPVDLYYRGVQIHDFNQTSMILDQSNNEKIKLTFEIPKLILRDLTSVCLHISGNQMVGFGKIRSNIVALH